MPSGYLSGSWLTPRLTSPGSYWSAMASAWASVSPCITTWLPSGVIISAEWVRGSMALLVSRGPALQKVAGRPPSHNAIDGKPGVTRELLSNAVHPRTVRGMAKGDEQKPPPICDTCLGAGGEYMEKNGQEKRHRAWVPCTSCNGTGRR